MSLFCRFCTALLATHTTQDMGFCGMACSQAHERQANRTRTGDRSVAAVKAQSERRQIEAERKRQHQAQSEFDPFRSGDES